MDSVESFLKKRHWIVGASCGLLAVVLLVVFAKPLISGDTASGDSDSISGETPTDGLEARLRNHMERITSREMEGRLNSTPGYRRAADYCAQFFASVGVAPGWPRPGTEADFFQPVREGRIDCANVIARIPGSDSRLQNEFITLGAHLDHIGRDWLGRRYPGANDDASGCAAVLEAARALAAKPPRRTIIFVLFTAEEFGHIGSQQFVRNPPVPLERVLMNVNIEQIGSAHRDYPGIFAFGPLSQRMTFESVGESVFGQWVLLEEIQNYLPAVRESDTWSFLEAKQPAMILSSGGFPEHHTSKDTVAEIDFDHLARATSVIISYVRELAGGDGAAAVVGGGDPDGAARVGPSVCIEANQTPSVAGSGH